MSYHDPEKSDPITSQVLAAADRLLAAGAGASFTMDQLVKEARVSRATIYRHLGNKEALLQRLAQPT